MIPQRVERQSTLRWLQDGKRVPQPQAREAREGAVRRDEFAPMLNGQGRDVASVTSGPLMSRHRAVKSPQCWRLGVMSEARGQSTSRWQNARAVSIGVAGSKMR